MSGSYKPVNERARLSFLDHLAILDTPPDPTIDRIVYTAAQLFRVPISAVTFVDEERQWFKASVGLRALQTARDVAFCSHTILSEHALIVENASLDPSFLNNPLVRDDPKVRFYAGSPLIAPGGLILGSLCVIDVLPRFPATEQMEILRQLAAEVTNIVCDRDQITKRLRFKM